MSLEFNSIFVSPHGGLFHLRRFPFLVVFHCCSRPRHNNNQRGICMGTSSIRCSIEFIRPRSSSCSMSPKPFSTAGK